LTFTGARVQLICLNKEYKTLETHSHFSRKPSSSLPTQIIQQKIFGGTMNTLRSVRSSACTEKCRKRGIRQLG